MFDTHAFITELADAGIQLSLVDSNLKLTSATGAPPDSQLLARIKQQKQVIIGYFKSLGGFNYSEPVVEKVTLAEGALLREEKLQEQDGQQNQWANMQLKQLSSDSAALLMVTPAVEDISTGNTWQLSPPEKEHLLYRLSRHGALLFRGTGLDSPEKVKQFAEQFITELYVSNTEHQEIANIKGVQSPVEYANEQFLLWHNENTFNHSWPSKIAFSCLKPAPLGGQTPLVDTRQFCARLPEELLSKFAELGVMYVRHYHKTDKFGLGWQTVFNTDDKEEVEKKCQQQGIVYQWRNNCRLITKAVRPAFMEHPVTREKCWVSQITHWHPLCLPQQVLGSMQAMFAVDEFPRNCLFGNGEPISGEDIALIVDAYMQAQFAFDWQAGDFLLVDNIVMAHARAPFAGDRKLCVVMGDMVAF
ncbi:TauD/TfdA family dioxygenase [Rheinheimera aquimaris]|jgi:alpha-ketoglutarate-dependent taurine dioxygenase|uniref:TauD/TfdA family dioxygenase n=1 Tax=Rheinheimera aquimaris TaxID=412437 RepID=UPI001066DF3F|nr:TauD/TfdA family dioxygenase [Rheinheimera aquimaris]